MSTTTWDVRRDVAVAERQSDSESFGAGAGDTLPVGLYSGYLYRSYLDFSYSFSGMTAINSAILHIKTSSQVKVGFGSDPDILVQRITSGTFAEGTAATLSTTNATEWSNQPTRTATGQATKDVTTAENTWVTIDITDIVQAAFAANIWYGIGIRASSESSSTDVTEFWAREYSSSNDAYVVVDYDTNTAPTAPTISAPTASQVTTPTPTITFAHNDSDGDALLNYDLQISTDSTFASVTHLNSALDTAGISGNTVTGTYGTTWVGTALTRGVTYYVRARTRSATGVSTSSAWSAARAFVINSLPVTTITTPTTGHTAKLSYSAGAGWTSPRLVVEWSRTDADASHSQYSYEVSVYSDSAGSPGSEVYNSGTVVSTASTLTIPYDLTENTLYHIKVRTSDVLETGNFTSYSKVRARWGVSLHYMDLTAAPTALSLATLNTTTTATSEVVMEYGSNTTTATPSTFYSTVGSVPLARYVFWRTYMYAWGSATPTAPSLDKLVFNYTSVVLIPDNWTRSDTTSGVMLSDPGSYVYGSKSLRIAANGSKYASQLVSVLPNTNYVLSGRIKSLGNSGGYFALEDALGTPLLQTTAVTATQDFTRDSLTVWNSGSRSSVYVVCRATGSSGTYAWFDALKLEASSVVTPWNPGFVGTAVQVDAGGLQVDASAGGIVRLRGSTGGTRDLVELGTHGLKFGGDLNIYSPAAGQWNMGDGSVNLGGTAFPASPATNDRYWRTDLNMEFFYNGTRWLSSTLHRTYMELWTLAQNTSLTATQVGVNRGPAPDLQGMSDLWIEKFSVSTFIAGGGTALSGSHKWDFALMAGRDQTNNTTDTLGSATLNSGSSTMWRRVTGAINALMNNGTVHDSLQVDITKTGTPGNITAFYEVTFRYVAT